MVSLLDDLQVEPEDRRRGCAMGKLLARLDEKERTAVVAAIDNGLSSTAIAHALQKNGYDVAHWTVSRHRRNECKCR